MYSGIFTLTESAAVAAIYMLFIGMFVYKELKVKDLPFVILKAFKSNTVIMLIVGGTNLFGWILTITHVSNHVGIFFAFISNNPSSRARFLYSFSSNQASYGNNN